MSIESKIKTISYNVNGIGSSVKSAQILAHLYIQNPDVIFLIDVRLSLSGQSKLRDQNPNFNFFFNSPSSQARGVVVMLHRRCPIKISDSWGDEVGNILILKGEFDGEGIIFSAVYGPNSDSPDFFQNLWLKLNNFGINNILVGGDFNVAIDPHKDTLNYQSVRAPRARREIVDALSFGGFCDPFRKIHKDKIDFTWSRVGGNQSARLDYFLTTNHMYRSIVECKSLPSFRSDHKPITISFDFKRVKKGRGFWKFDNSLLLDKDFESLARKEIRLTCAKYLVHPIYMNFLNEASQQEVDNFLNIPLQDLTILNYNIDYDLLLVQIFNDIKNLEISFRSMKAKSNSFKAKALLKEIENSFSPVEKGRLQEEYDSLVVTLADEHLNKMAKVSKIEGEKASQWFLRLEKSINDQKFIGQLYNSQNCLTSNQSEIESEIRDFYQKLYSQSEQSNSSLEDIIDFLPPICVAPQVSTSEVTALDQDMTVEEIGEFLKKVNFESSPGYTGISYKFINHFFSPLGFFLAKAANDIFRKGIFPDTFKIGILSLLPKGDKDKKFLKNWRPICLLDCVYKIFSGVLTMRLNRVLPNIISISQSGFVNGRCINDSLRLLADVLDYGKRFDKSGIIVSIDFCKAFDTLSFNFILNALKFFGFGNNFIRWVSITQNEFQVCTSNAGNIAPPFVLGKGVKQGDPLSPGLFVIALEILSLKIQNDMSIKGYKLGNFEVKQSFFADDSIFILDRDESSVKKVVKTLEGFGNISGLFINVEKSSLMEFGPSSGAPFCPSIPFIRAKKLTYLGLVFTANLNNMEQNLDDKLESIKMLGKCWKNRHLSIYGKNIVAKTLMISKINNVIMVLPNLKKTVIDKCEKVIYSFLWNDKNDQVKRQDAKIGEAQGGLNLPNLSTAIHAFKIQWFRRLYKTDTLWARVLNELLIKVSPSLNIYSLLRLGDLGWVKISNKIPSAFWKACMKAPISPFRDFIKANPDLVINLSICDNSLIKYQDSALGPRAISTLKPKAFFVSDLINQISKRIFTYEEFVHLFGPVDRIQFNKTSNALELLLTSFRYDTNNLRLNNPLRPAWSAFFNVTNKGCSGWTRYLRVYRSDNIRIREAKWEVLLGKTLGPTYWDKTYRNLCTISFNNQLKWFQYNLNRGSLKVNSIISKFVPNQSENCSFCLTFKEDIIHLFWACERVKAFFIILRPFLMSINIPWPPPSRENFIFGDCKNTFLSEIEYTYLLIKHYIWVTRCLKNELTLVALKNKVKSNLILDLHFYGRRGEGGQLINAKEQFQFLSNLADKMGIG